MTSNGPSFDSRCRIRGTITTTSPLVIGSGTTTSRPGLSDVEVNAVVIDHRDRAYLPGTTIKGCLRAWLSARNIADVDIEKVFGSPDPKKKNARGGCAEFGDAYALDTVQLPADPVPYWSDRRLTGVGSKVAIERQRRVAAAEKLVHFEFVPAGVSFDVSITGQDLSSQDVATLLLALEAIRPNGLDSITFGAETLNGFGRCAWQLTEIGRITSDPTELRTWVAHHHVGYDGLPTVTSDVQAEIERAKAVLVTGRSGRAGIELGLRLRFQGPFLVNDPSQSRKKAAGDDDDDDLDPASREPDHAPLLDGDGGPLLPARSLRGALRSQAERILRTIHLDRRVACRPTSTRQACRPIAQVSEREKLCLACQVFGAPGWAAPIGISAFTREPGSRLDGLCQEFVAIDRFTGGGARGLKFNAKSFYQPVLEGRIVLDLARLEPWGLGLLVLALRDLVEGDVAVGFGQAKGYGAVQADVTQFAARNVPAWLGAMVSASGLAVPEPDVVVSDPLRSPTPQIQALLVKLVGDLHAKVDHVRRSDVPGGKPA